MSAAFAERERHRRGLGDRVEILTGGTRPADSVHEGVIEAMAEVGIDIADRTPREIPAAELRSCDYVATMGCSTLDIGEVDDDTELREWALEDPDGKDIAGVRAIRAEIERKVTALFDELDV